MLLADATTSPLPHLFSGLTFLVLLAILVASVVMFAMLVLRWTVYHRWADLQQWADENGLTLQGRGKATLVPPLDAIKDRIPTAVLSISNAKLTILEMRTLETDRSDTSQYTRWHAVVRQTGTYWYPSGLRPRASASSLLDLFPLTSFPSMLPPDRFVVFGTDSASARRLAHSKLSALLPPDVGLLLHGETLLLDFSSRPLDTIELSRLSELLEQIWQNLPAVDIKSSD